MSYWSLMSRFWCRVFLFFFISFIKHSFLFVFVAYFFGLGLCGMAEVEFRADPIDFPFFLVFIGCISVSFVVAIFDIAGQEKYFCKTCIEKIEDDFLSGEISKSNFEACYSRLKPFDEKVRQRERLEKEKERAMREKEELMNEIYWESRKEREIFLADFKRGEARG